MWSKWQPRMQHSQLEWRSSLMGRWLLKRPKVIPPTPEWLRHHDSSNELDKMLQSTNPHNHSRIIYHQRANINKSGQKLTFAHTSACIRGHVVPFCQEMRAPNPIGSIHIHPNMTFFPQPGMSCVLIPAIGLQLQRPGFLKRNRVWFLRWTSS